MNRAGRWRFVPAGLAPVILIGGWTIAAAHQPDTYRSTRDTISALAAHGATDRWIMTTALAAVGFCYLATASALGRARPAGRVLLAIGGAATIAVAALAQPSPGHAPAATIAFVALALWPAASVLFGRRPSLTVTAVLLVLVGAFVISFASDTLVGLSERVLAGAESLWPALAVLVVAGWSGPNQDQTASSPPLR